MFTQPFCGGCVAGYSVIASLRGAIVHGLWDAGESTTIQERNIHGLAGKTPEFDGLIGLPLSAPLF